MQRSWRILLVLGLYPACSTNLLGEESPARPPVRVELRWVETSRIAGVTDDEGFQTSCDPMSVMFPHREPALVLTAADVTVARLSRHNFRDRPHFLVTLELSRDARDRLARTCQNDEPQLLTVVLNGKYWGLRRYERNPDQPLVPVQARAETWSLDVGFFSSEGEAERLAAAFR